MISQIFLFFNALFEPFMRTHTVLVTLEFSDKDKARKAFGQFPEALRRAILAVASFFDKPQARRLWLKSAGASLQGRYIRLHFEYKSLFGLLYRSFWEFSKDVFGIMLDYKAHDAGLGMNQRPFKSGLSPSGARFELDVTPERKKIVVMPKPDDDEA